MTAVVEHWWWSAGPGLGIAGEVGDPQTGNRCQPVTGRLLVFGLGAGAGGLLGVGEPLWLGVGCAVPLGNGLGCLVVDALGWGLGAPVVALGLGCGCVAAAHVADPTLMTWAVVVPDFTVTCIAMIVFEPSAAVEVTP